MVEINATDSIRKLVQHFLKGADNISLHCGINNKNA